ncbi:MAG: hypothetical protein NZM10_00795 [Fimbriimonadales bacterium]|nr:hypothetical protein [Fimbriimonadales bacterium]
MARKRVALILPTNNRSETGYTRNLPLARLWKNTLRLWGVDADIIVAGDVSKAWFNSNYDLGIVPNLERLTYWLPIYSWISYSAGDKPLYLCGYHVPQNTAGTPATGVLGLTPIGNPTNDLRMIGRRAVWTGSGIKVHIASYTASESNALRGLRVDTSNPNLQVLLRPDPELHPTDTHVYIARWHNRYFVPTVGSSFWRSSWLIPWIMVNEGAAPEWSRPWSADIDHIVAVSAAIGINFDYYLQSVQWLRNFCLQTGLVVQCGVTTSALSQIMSGWRFLHRNARNHNAQMQQIHQIIVAEQHRCFPVCFHDHAWTIEDTRGAGNATTFTNPYGTFRELSSPAAFRAHWKGSMDEMRQMGFTDGHCGAHRYMNFATNQFSDRYLRFLRDETPVRAVRLWAGSCMVSRHTRLMSPAPYTRNPLERRYGIEIIDSYDTIYTDVDVTRVVLTRQAIAIGGGYGTSSDDPAIIWARSLGHRFGELMWEKWLRSGALHYHHELELSTEYPSAAMDLYIEMGAWRQILAGWMFLGSVSDVVAWRNRVRSM